MRSSGLAGGAVVLLAMLLGSSCSTEREELQYAQVRQHFDIASPFTFSTTVTEAESILGTAIDDQWNALSSSEQSCLEGEGIKPGNASVSCLTTADYIEWDPPFTTSTGKKITGACYWSCKVTVPSEGYYYWVHVTKEYKEGGATGC